MDFTYTQRITKTTSGKPENHRTKNKSQNISTEEIQSKHTKNQQKLKLKTMCMGNIDENISEKDLHELFGLK